MQLLSTGFHQQKPEILTLKPLPIPPGHSEGPFDVSPKDKETRAYSRRLHTLNRESEYINSTASASFSSENDDDTATDDTTDESTSEGNDSTENGGMLEDEHSAFLNSVFDALKGKIDLYDLSLPMTKLPHSDAASDLAEWGYLDKVTIGNNQVYYIPTKEGELVADRKLVSPQVGSELGGESAEHHLGVRLAQHYYKQQGYDVTLYGDINDGTNKTDVFASATKESPTDRNQLVEVETSPEKKQHVIDDYNALKEGYGDVIWVVENYKKAVTLLDKLGDETERLPTGHPEQSLEKRNNKLDDPGISMIRTLDDLQKDLK